MSATVESWDTGQQLDSKGFWWNAGGRANYALSEHLSMLLECGHSSIKHDSEKKNDGVTNVGARKMSRITLSTQVTANKNYWGRPVLRFFITQSFWNNLNKGDANSTVSGVDEDGSFRVSNSAANIGFQGEVWF